MNLPDILARLDFERRTISYDGDRLEALPLVTRLAAGSFHSVIFSALSGASADQAIAGEIEHHRGLKIPFEWKVFAHDKPADLRARLEGRGFTIGEQEAVLVCPIMPPAAWVTDTDTSSIRRVTHINQLAHYDAVQRDAFGESNDHILASLAEALRKNSTQHTAFIAYDGDLPVAIGRLYTHPQSHFAGLYGGGTIRSHRGKGFYRALVAARAGVAATHNARYLQVDARPTSRPILERLGFVHLTDTWPCEWNPSA